MKSIIAFTLFLLAFSSFSAQAQQSKISQNEAKKNSLRNQSFAGQIKYVDRQRQLERARYFA